MRDYFIAVDDNDDYLMHYGVLGMKWHHHMAKRYAKKAKRSEWAALNERNYRRDFDRDMNRRMNKNDPSDVEGWQNTRRAEHEASHLNEEHYRDSAKRYHKKSQEHLAKNQANYAKIPVPTENKRTKKAGYYDEDGYFVDNKTGEKWAVAGKTKAKYKKYNSL